eukprot:TRINITY_DN3554_c0_g2_i3.p1 TRINITY_DN3554_c0_g2~~TRINITY_DN3554_c0_g2_i3.p1  ORF type:complete len:542 (+),score=69.91 TRINITY_DN3554_c0_g2_i3:82-1626(+)
MDSPEDTPFSSHDLSSDSEESSHDRGSGHGLIQFGIEEEASVPIGSRTCNCSSKHVRCGKRVVPKESIKAAVFMVLILIAGVILGLVREEDTRSIHHLSVTSDTPIYLRMAIGTDLEITLNVPPLTDLTHHTPEKTCLGFPHNLTNKNCNKGYPRLEGVLVVCEIQSLHLNDNQTEMWHTIESWNVSLDSFEEKRHVLFFDRNDTDLDKTRIFLTTNHTLPVAVLLDAHPIPLVARYRVLLASIILFLLYALIISELVHQTIAAMFCAFLSLSCLSLVHDRPSLDLVITWIDFGTIGLLFGMMIMVGIFSRTGFFEWAAVKAYKLSRGNLWTLMVLLSTFTCLISSVLDNVTTIILIVPVTIKLCRVLDVDPKLLILSEIIFSNIGGTSTIIGDPPNIIIAGNVYVAPYVNFLTFSAHVTVGVLLCLPVTWFYLWFFYSSSLHRDPVLRVKAEIQTWYKTLSRLDELDPSQVEVRAHVLTYLTKLEEKASELQMKTTEPATIGEMEANYTIKDW